MAWVLASVFLMRVVARISLRVCGARASANVVGAAAAATSVRPVFIWALRVTVLAPCMAVLTPALHCILSIPLAPCTRQPRQAAILPGDFVSPHTDLLSLCTHAHPAPPQDAPLRCRHRCTRQRLRLCAWRATRCARVRQRGAAARRTPQNILREFEATRGRTAPATAIDYCVKALVFPSLMRAVAACVCGGTSSRDSHLSPLQVYFVDLSSLGIVV